MASKYACDEVGETETLAGGGGRADQGRRFARRYDCMEQKKQSTAKQAANSNLTFEYACATAPSLINVV